VRDPVERIRKFVEEQQQQARLEHARATWAGRIREVLPTVEAVVDAFRCGLAPDQFQRDPVSVLADPKRDLFPLVVAFGPRVAHKEGVIALRPRPAEEETGASALFRCEADGCVYGYRYPFHGVLHSPAPEPFADLGDPSTIHAHELGNAVAAFLEWAAVGAGCGDARLSFWAPPAPVVQPQKLTLVAA
jgi:hypothetical protein